MEVGLRVVRGPDWKYGEQDGGEGHVGTVVELGEDSTSVPDDCVVVLWDSGIRKTYRAGHEGCFDLLVLDNGICGVKHENISCDGCQKREIEGVRWKCGVCSNFDLCTTCYMDDKHDVTHTFLRLYAPSTESVAVGKRADVREKKAAMGIFVGATVCRGCDWRWDDQDGGAGTEGLVLEIGDWGEDSYGSKATVLWPSLSIKNYRIGHDGDVDLRCIKPSKGGNYYKEHLAVLGKMKGRLKKRDGSGLAAALALGLLGESLLSRPLQRMLVMHQMLEAFKEIVTGSPEDMHVGTRVVRGPDWKWMNQDGGVGHVGTVVKATPEQTVTVVWDSGDSNVYRIGKDNMFDLLVYDNAPCGVVHSTVKCDECKTDAIRGIRWKCSECENYDLCHVCYMTDKHTRYHKFYRIDWPDDKMVLVPPRSEGGRERVQSRGIFKGATVSRGRDWNYGDQDGSAGKEGKVVEIRNWENESGRSEARVSWSFFSKTCSYRVGHEGQVDLKYVTPGLGLVYYKNHLPVLVLSNPALFLFLILNSECPNMIPVCKLWRSQSKILF
ncbi:uncharacterized protein LOC131953789 [Physella acuta]|uniref:uncharacterized protein LOC131953789 n=1 Tax=Physella acuta TaxID=109671 RepID=UPI0027DE290A|nr:uncharacterized protein LOC131953789 [Physella acuta]